MARLEKKGCVLLSIGGARHAGQRPSGASQACFCWHIWRISGLLLNIASFCRTDGLMVCIKLVAS